MSAHLSKTVPFSEFFRGPGPKIGPLLVPPESLIELAGKQLRWSKWPRADQVEGPFRKLNPEPHAFERFLNLANSRNEQIRNEQILRFAVRNGVLGLCKHGLPLCHGAKDEDQIREGGHTFCEPDLVRSAITEPLETWQNLSLEAAALLKLKLIHTEGASKPNELEQAWTQAHWLIRQLHERCGYLGYHALLDDRNPRLSQIPRRLAKIANEWLRCGGVLPILAWRAPHYLFTWAVPNQRPNLFGFLALRLASSLADLDGLAVCAGCKAFFIAESTISRRRRGFCSSCREGKKPSLHATRDYRARVREARRLRDKGYTASQIAKELRRSPEQIKKWVEIKLTAPVSEAFQN